ncbi:MAG: three-Cys-motif partner protein TcmP [Thermoplasmatales archaeon]|nr:MAG: three-Cys-motif partner protein TcmP [Thermoplasmatales archaeon]
MDVKLHTKLKHKIISYYFSGGWKNAFKSGNIYSLYYVDLFAGDGSCFCSEIDPDLEKILPRTLSERNWKPSYFDLMRHADDANFNLKCVFNDISENNINSLMQEIKNKRYTKFIEGYFSKNANISYTDILKLIDKPNKPSLFYIDPTNHSQLNFSTVEAIAKFKDEKSGRMPELIINLMLNSIYMAFKRGLQKEDVESINRFLGTNYDRNKINEIITDPFQKSYKILLNIYLEKLQELGYYCNYHLIKSTKSNAPIYYLLFATFSKQVDDWYKNINSYVHTLEEEWIKKNYVIKTMSDAKKDGQTFLFDFE